jgi:hypothetical protein
MPHGPSPYFSVLMFSVTYEVLHLASGLLYLHWNFYLASPPAVLPGESAEGLTDHRAI